MTRSREEGDAPSNDSPIVETLDFPLSAFSLSAPDQVTSLVRRLDIIGRLDGIQVARKIAFDFLKPIEGVNALDIGCGLGDDVYNLMTLGAISIGIDLNEFFLTIARGRFTDAEFIQADAERMGFIDGYFGVILANRILMHTPNPHNVVKEARRCLAQDGRIAIIEPLWRELKVNFLAEGTLEIQESFLTNLASALIGEQLEEVLAGHGLKILSEEFVPLLLRGLSEADAALGILNALDRLVANTHLSQAQSEAWKSAAAQAQSFSANVPLRIVIAGRCE